MTREILTVVLDSEGFKSGPKGYVISEDREATCLISAPGDVFPVARVLELQLCDKYIVLRTAKKENLYFAYEDVLGLRFMASATASSSARDRVAGFSR